MSGAGDEDMRTDLEVVIVRACCNSSGKEELYWIVSRSQLEFVVKELDQVDASKATVMANYQGEALPVISLEKYFGYVAYRANESSKYMVLRSVDKQKQVRKLIVESENSPKFFKLIRSFAALDSYSAPENSEHILGAYSLGKGKVGIVPDIVGIIEKLV